jgi:hypothetical protein
MAQGTKTQGSLEDLQEVRQTADQALVMLDEKQRKIRRMMELSEKVAHLLNADAARLMEDIEKSRGTPDYEASTRKRNNHMTLDGHIALSKRFTAIVQNQDEEALILFHEMLNAVFGE